MNVASTSTSTPIVNGADACADFYRAFEAVLSSGLATNARTVSTNAPPTTTTNLQVCFAYLNINCI